MIAVNLPKQSMSAPTPIQRSPRAHPHARAICNIQTHEGGGAGAEEWAEGARASEASAQFPRRWAPIFPDSCILLRSLSRPASDASSSPSSSSARFVRRAARPLGKQSPRVSHDLQKSRGQRATSGASSSLCLRKISKARALVKVSLSRPDAPLRIIPIYICIHSRLSAARLGQREEEEAEEEEDDPPSCRR